MQVRWRITGVFHKKMEFQTIRERSPIMILILWADHRVNHLRMHPQLSLRWRHNGHDSVSNHQPHDCLLSRLLGCGSKKTSKLRVTGLCAGNSPGTGEFSAQMASYAENVSIWWRHHVRQRLKCMLTGLYTTKHRKTRQVFRYICRSFVKQVTDSPTQLN